VNGLPFEIPPDIVSFLQLVITPTFGAWAVSAFVENEPWFQGLMTEWKSRVVFLALLLLSIGGRVALNLMTQQQVTVQDFYLGVMVAFVSFASSQWYHVKTTTSTTTLSVSAGPTVTSTTTKQPDAEPPKSPESEATVVVAKG
jgi:hypothetical protein